MNIPGPCQWHTGMCCVAVARYTWLYLRFVGTAPLLCDAAGALTMS